MKVCGVCLHPNRESIDSAMVSARPLRTIAGQFGLSKSALSRHRGHIEAAIVKARESCEAHKAISLLERIENLIYDCNSIAAKASRARQWTPAVGALREVRGCIELLGKLSGELAQTPNVNIGIGVKVGTESHLSHLSDEEIDCRLYRWRLDAWREHVAKVEAMLIANDHGLFEKQIISEPRGEVTLDGSAPLEIVVSDARETGIVEPRAEVAGAHYHR